MRRDTFFEGAIATVALFSASSFVAGAESEPKIGKIEEDSGGRLGVFAFDTASGQTLSHRANERFPMCSTFKFLAVAAVLARVDTARERLGRHIAFGKSDLLEYAPVTREHVSDGFMTVSALCEAAIVYSDNTAANLLLRTIGGPLGATDYARTLRDRFTNLSRTEPTLNTALPNDPRDTTTPIAMAKNMRKLLLDDALSRASRARLSAWLFACRTGHDCLRAGVPSHWRSGDKTGSGDNGTRNDIAILLPPKRPPIIVTAYLTGSKLSANARDTVLAAVGRLVVNEFA